MFTLDFPELFRDEGLNGLGSLDHEAEGRELAAATTVQDANLFWKNKLI